MAVEHESVNAKHQLIITSYEDHFCSLGSSLKEAEDKHDEKSKAVENLEICKAELVSNRSVSVINSSKNLFYNRSLERAILLSSCSLPRWIYLRVRKMRRCSSPALTLLWRSSCLQSKNFPRSPTSTSRHSHCSPNCMILLRM